jgi:hypothetical protein
MVAHGEDEQDEHESEHPAGHRGFRHDTSPDRRRERLARRFGPPTPIADRIVMYFTTQSVASDYG